MAAMTLLPKKRDRCMGESLQMVWPQYDDRLQKHFAGG
ncbi:hypothetical protein KPSA1_02425 [Pseudomonas syringae pv. actinidiae]|uniref:Uncharacterized protein n=1 Tax=Pseudomonas syringae pv. actinidiae TaxID=103796 RepID=A0A2V0Q8I4_PSESF|nr:hypothetical protein KPSA1_02425 [Pseudomonas syringae pv. actinidiae]